MSELFGAYKVAILDSSFFTSEFSQDVKNGLKSIKVYVAGTFYSELEQYRLFLSKDKLDIFESNLAFLRESILVNTVDMTTVGEKGTDLHNDIWGLISLLAKLNGKFVVITANQILIQRIILNNILADIYDLNTNWLRSAATFHSSRGSYEFGQTFPNIHAPEKIAKEGTILYKSDASTIVLGSEIHSGLEGVLYKIKDNDKEIAKVFNKDELPADKFSNLKNIVGINKRYDIPFVAFPVDLLFYDAERTVPAGFTEALVESGENLGENPLYLGNIADCPEEKLNIPQSASIDLCLKIVRQVCYLNVLGFFISDFNYSNFSTISSNSPYVQMWDADSFGYGKYFSGIDAGYRLSRAYNYSVKSEAVESCFDELYLFVFSILALGDYPISEKDGVFKYSKSEYLSTSIAQLRKKVFPTELWELFSDVFTQKKGASAEALLYQLTISIQKIKELPSADRTYAELLSDDLSHSENEKSQNNTGGGSNLGNNANNGRGQCTGPSNNNNSGSGSGNSGDLSNNRNGSRRKRKHTIGEWIIDKSYWIIAACITLILLVAYNTTTKDEKNLHSPSSIYTSSQASGIMQINFNSMRQSEAESKIASYGWSSKIVQEYNGTVRKGCVSGYDLNSSSKIVTLHISRGGFPEDTVIVGKASASISASKSDVDIYTGKSTTITVSASGSALPNTFHFSVSWYPEIETAWGAWHDDGVSANLTIIGNSPSSGYARVYLVDAATDKKIAYTDIYITVK